MIRRLHAKTLSVSLLIANLVSSPPSGMFVRATYTERVRHTESEKRLTLVAEPSVCATLRLDSRIYQTKLSLTADRLDTGVD